MNDFLLVVVIASVAAFLTYLGAPLAERFLVPHEVISAALQFAAGILTALVFFSLMPPAYQIGSPIWITLAFFVGGASFVIFEYYTSRRLASQTDEGEEPISLGLTIGVLVDLVIDGAVIGLGASLTLATGMVLALGIALSTLPLAFVTTATVKRQGMGQKQRRILSWLYIICIMVGAIVAYTILRNQSDQVRVVIVALASGFLITTVTQSIIPAANVRGEPSFAGLFFIGGLALYGFLTLGL